MEHLVVTLEKNNFIRLVCVPTSHAFFEEMISAYKENAVISSKVFPCASLHYDRLVADLAHKKWLSEDGTMAVLRPLPDAPGLFVATASTHFDMILVPWVTARLQVYDEDAGILPVGTSLASTFIAIDEMHWETFQVERYCLIEHDEVMKQPCFAMQACEAVENGIVLTREHVRALVYSYLVLHPCFGNDNECKPFVRVAEDGISVSHQGVVMPFAMLHKAAAESLLSLFFETPRIMNKALADNPSWQKRYTSTIVSGVDTSTGFASYSLLESYAPVSTALPDAWEPRRAAYPIEEILKEQSQQKKVFMVNKKHSSSKGAKLTVVDRRPTLLTEFEFIADVLYTDPLVASFVQLIDLHGAPSEKVGNELKAIIDSLIPIRPLFAPGTPDPTDKWKFVFDGIRSNPLPMHVAVTTRKADKETQDGGSWQDTFEQPPPPRPMLPPAPAPVNTAIATSKVEKMWNLHESVEEHEDFKIIKKC
jgi:hypothetical protein